MTEPQDLVSAVKALRDEHVYPSYDSDGEEVWGLNPHCSCGRQKDDCDVLPLLAIVDQL